MDNNELFDKETTESIKGILIAQKSTLAVAESVTSGFIQAALSTAKDALKFYQGGITVYNVGQKYRHLLVEPIHALATNCVSEKVAAEMAVNVCELFRSEWGISITGFASPVPESNNELYAYYAIANERKVIKVARIDASSSMSPVDAQLFYVQHILTELLSVLESTGNKGQL
jgi:nicotinamide-nucleotide amidase